MLTCQGLSIAPFQSLQVQRWPQSWKDLGFELHPLRFGGVGVVRDLPAVGEKKGGSGCGETPESPKMG